MLPLLAIMDLQLAPDSAADETIDLENEADPNQSTNFSEGSKVGENDAIVEEEDQQTLSVAFTVNENSNQSNQTGTVHIQTVAAQNSNSANLRENSVVVDAMTNDPVAQSGKANEEFFASVGADVNFSSVSADVDASDGGNEADTPKLSSYFGDAAGTEGDPFGGITVSNTDNTLSFDETTVDQAQALSQDFGRSLQTYV